MNRHGNSNQNQTQGNNQFQNNQQQRQAFATQQILPLPPPPPLSLTQQGVSSNQGLPSSVSIQSGQSYSSKQPQGWWIFIPN